MLLFLLLWNTYSAFRLKIKIIEQSNIAQRDSYITKEQGQTLLALYKY